MSVSRVAPETADVSRSMKFPSANSCRPHVSQLASNESLRNAQLAVVRELASRLFFFSESAFRLANNGRSAKTSAATACAVHVLTIQKFLDPLFPF